MWEGAGGVAVRGTVFLRIAVSLSKPEGSLG